jgi:hypothetical protein
MAALLAVVALGLIAYVPGRSLLRCLLPASGRDGRARLLLELLLGNAAVGVAGFALAEAGAFSLTAVLIAVATITLAARLAAGGRIAPYTSADLAGALLAALALVWVMPPFDTSLYGADSSVYAGSGLHLARHGEIAYDDPSLDAMPLAARRSFFPSYGREAGQPPFVRLAGGLLLSDLTEPVVLPAFHHLLSVWVALAWSIGGDAALGAPAVYFAALALWAIAVFAHGLGGGVAAMSVALLLALSAPQLWYSRFLMPEIPSQYFLWAGLVAGVESLRTSGARLGVAAGLGLGMAGLMRLDGLAHIIAALALWRALAGGWPSGRGFLPAFGTLVVWALAHQALFPTHYLAEVLGTLRQSAARLQPTLRALGLAAIAGVVTRGRLSGTARLLLRAGALAVFAAYGIATTVSTRPDLPTTLGWLVSYAGWPVLVAGVIGFGLWLRRASGAAERFALLLGVIVLAQLFYDPRVTPAPLWAIRRFLPVAIPVLLLGAALTAAALWQRRRALGAAGLVLLAFGATGGSALSYRAPAFQNGIDHVRALGALLPRNAIVVVDPRFALQSQIHIALWSAVDTPAYLLTAEMHEPMEKLQALVAPRPVYWLGSADDRALSTIGTRAELVASYRFGIGVRRLDWYDDRDDLGVRDLTAWLFRLPDPNGRALH